MERGHPAPRSGASAAPENPCCVVTLKTSETIAWEKFFKNIFKEWRGQTMSTSGLSQARLGRMHDIMSNYVERGEVPGLVTLVSRRGEAHVDVIGNMGYEDRHAMQRDT